MEGIGDDFIDKGLSAFNEALNGAEIGGALLARRVEGLGETEGGG